MKVAGRWGDVSFIDKDIYVGASLYHYGEYNPDETEKIIALAEIAGKDKLCLDIGANFGVMAQALEYNGFECQCFEPQPYVFGFLTQNVKGKCHNVAVGAEVGTAKMTKILNGSKANYGGNAIGFRSELGTITVPVITIDSLDLPTTGFMKIDVEGYELNVLRGAVNTITRDRPILYIEDDRPENSKDLRAFINLLGYTIEEHKPPLYREENFFGKRHNIWNARYVSHNIICMPQ
jgi:FkbM family methyltransferase